MKAALLQIIKQIAVLAVVAALYVLVRRWDTIAAVQTIPFVAATFSPALTATIERHIWQFVFGMIGLTIISRGNLWSCGINSMNVRRSLLYLLGFYGAAAVILIALSAAAAFIDIRFDLFPTADRFLVMTIHWLSSPVADQILFFGLFQTILLRYWTDTVTLFSEKIPSVILLTALIFALGRTGLPHFTTQGMEYAAGYGVGLFAGIVYYKTRSLLTPMLAQAFFFGMPDALHIISSSIGYRL